MSVGTSKSAGAKRSRSAEAKPAGKPGNPPADETGHEAAAIDGKGTISRRNARLALLEAPWRDYLAKHHLNASWARDAVVETFLEMPGHIDLQALHARVKERHPGVGLATVYRTVKLMQNAGIVQARHFADRSAVYEVVAGREHHDHLICERCGQIVEFSDADIERIQDDIARDHGFVLVSHRHELFGLCTGCRASSGGRLA